MLRLKVLMLKLLLSVSTFSFSDAVDSRNCRFDDSKMELFGLAAYSYENKKNANKENLSWYLFRWSKSKPDNPIVSYELSSDTGNDPFREAKKILSKNKKDTHSYAVVWEDVSRQSKYGENIRTVIVSAAYGEGLAYRAFYREGGITDLWVEVGCDINLLAVN